MVALVALMAMTAWAEPAWAFCRTTTCAEKGAPAECVRDANGCWAAGIPLVWTQQCVSFSVSGLGSPRLGLDYPAAEALVQSAFSMWTNAMCPDGFPSIAISSLGPLMCERREYNSTGPNANAVLFRDEGWPHDPGIIALTTVSFDPNTGKLLNADMEVNTQWYDQLGQLEIKYVVAHEAGHFLGLDHSREPTAIMYYRDSFTGMSDPMLTPDDLAGLCAAYPPDRAVPPTCNFEPPKGFATDCGGNVTASCAVPPGPVAPRQLVMSALFLLAMCSGAAIRARSKRSRRPGRFKASSSPCAATPDRQRRWRGREE